MLTPFKTRLLALLGIKIVTHDCIAAHSHDVCVGLVRPVDIGGIDVLLCTAHLHELANFSKNRQKQFERRHEIIIGVVIRYHQLRGEVVPHGRSIRTQVGKIVAAEREQAVGG